MKIKILRNKNKIRLRRIRMNNPNRMAFMQHSVWVPLELRYFNFWFSFMCTLNRKLLLEFHCSCRSRKGKWSFPWIWMTSLCSKMPSSISLCEVPSSSGFQMEVVNCKSSSPHGSLTLNWNVSIQWFISSCVQVPLNVANIMNFLFCLSTRHSMTKPSVVVLLHLWPFLVHNVAAVHGHANAHEKINMHCNVASSSKEKQIILNILKLLFLHMTWHWRGWSLEPHTNALH